MALIAGYVAREPEDTHAVLERVRQFAVVPDESPADYKNVVMPIRHGHLILKHRQTHPLPPKLACAGDGSLVALLGFTFRSECQENLAVAAVRSGAEILEGCEGEFVAVFAHAAGGAVHIVNDRFGARPFYLLRESDGIYFSSNIAFLLELAGVTHSPDLTGWLEATAFGHTLGGRTTVQNVERLTPGTHVIVTPERKCERQYWRLEHRPDPDLDPDAHAAATFEAFRSSVARRARLVGKGIVALSGGLDSRLLAGALPDDVDFTAFTFINEPGAASTAETRSAAAVSAALGLPHHLARVSRDCVSREDVIALTGGMRPYQHMAIVMAYVEEMRRLQSPFLLGGGPGDSLAGAFVPSMAYADPQRLEESMANAHRRRMANARAWSLAFRDDVIAAHRPVVERELSESLSAVQGPTAAHRITAWAMRYRQPAFTFTSVLHAHPEVSEAAAHLDYRYADLMLRLPGTWLYKKAFYAYMIHQSLPQLQHVPYANVKRRLSGVMPGQKTASAPFAQAAEVASSYAQRIVRRLTGRFVRPQPTLSTWLLNDATLLKHVNECIHSIPALRDALDVRRCERLLRKTQDSDCPSEDVVGGLVALSVSLTALPRSQRSRRLFPVLGAAFQSLLEVAPEAMLYVWNFRAAVA